MMCITISGEVQYGGGGPLKFSVKRREVGVKLVTLISKRQITSVQIW